MPTNWDLLPFNYSFFFVLWLFFLSGLAGCLVILWTVLRYCCTVICSGYLRQTESWKCLSCLKFFGALQVERSKFTIFAMVSLTFCFLSFEWITGFSKARTEDTMCVWALMPKVIWNFFFSLTVPLIPPVHIWAIITNGIKHCRMSSNENIFRIEMSLTILCIVWSR